MVDSDKDFFSSELQHFKVVNRLTLAPEAWFNLRREYWTDLSKMSRADFERACAELRRTAEWFPKPFEFFRAARKGWM